MPSLPPQDPIWAAIASQQDLIASPTKNRDKLEEKLAVKNYQLRQAAEVLGLLQVKASGR